MARVVAAVPVDPRPDAVAGKDDIRRGSVRDADVHGKRRDDSRRVLEKGGRATVILDGKPARPLDAWTPARTHDTGLWHVFGLAQGPHSVRIDTTGKADSRSTGTEVVIVAAVVYRNK